MEALALQSARKLECRVAEVQEAFEVGHDFDVVVLKDLVLGLELVVKIHLIRKSATAAAGHGYAHEKVFGQFIARFDFVNFGFGAVRYVQHSQESLRWDNKAAARGVAALL